MKKLLASLAFAVAAPVLAQSLPELGDRLSSALSPALERKIGEQAMQDIRLHDPHFLDDPELTEYINTLGQRLVAAAPDARLDFQFFIMQDSTINAFAMPGGFVGVHTGLLLAAQTESELAGVLAHEVAHVTQRHLARMLGQQQQMSIPTIAALVVAVLASRSGGDISQGIIAAAGAGSIQAQLNYTRDYEREADRVGFQILQGANFDVNGMAAFFERLQKATRIYENNAPAYMRTHPLTTERIADMQSRAYHAVYRQSPDSLEFHLVRAKLRAEQGSPRDAKTHFTDQVRERRYANEAAARYGLALALSRARDYTGADAEIARLRKLVGTEPMVELLAARIKAANGDQAGARDVLQAALAHDPNYRPLSYALVQSLQALGQHERALQLLEELVRNTPRDPRLYSLKAQSHAALGQRLLQHQAQAEAYYLDGTLAAAIEQLQLAQKSGDADFYQLSSVDARLRELRRLQADEARKR
ncbi:MAG TPA: M48 family metalloprotease [Burkholderiales bacterium]|nr:M48 family metalloprotease [Burkholderiales bacterium]